MVVHVSFIVQEYAQPRNWNVFDANMFCDLTAVDAFSEKKANDWLIVECWYHLLPLSSMRGIWFQQVKRN